MSSKGCDPCSVGTKEASRTAPPSQGLGGVAACVPGREPQGRGRGAEAGPWVRPPWTPSRPEPSLGLVSLAVSVTQGLRGTEGMNRRALLLFSTFFPPSGMTPRERPSPPLRLGTAKGACAVTWERGPSLSGWRVARSCVSLGVLGELPGQ